MSVILVKIKNQTREAILLLRCMGDWPGDEADSSV